MYLLNNNLNWENCIYLKHVFLIVSSKKETKTVENIHEKLVSWNEKLTLI